MKKIIITIFGVICGFSIIIFVLFNYVLYPTKFNDFVIFYSEKYSLDKALVFAIIKTESNFDTRAVSSAGALGLMQILPSTASWIASELGEDFQEENLLDAGTNIRFGCFYLNYLFSKFDSTDIVICAYNAGEGAVKDWLNDEGELEVNLISYSETLAYFKKVKSAYSVYHNHEICF